MRANFCPAQDFDVDAIAPQVDGKFMSAFVRAVKPQQAKTCCGPTAATVAMRERQCRSTYNVLFLCTGNSARSIMAEAILNRKGQGRLYRLQRGQPSLGRSSTRSIKQLEALIFRSTGLRSKSWDEFAKPGAPKLDFVFTVCDNAAKEVCPFWPGQPMTAHWGVPDPAAVQGTQEVDRSLSRRLHHARPQNQFVLVPAFGQSRPACDQKRNR